MSGHDIPDTPNTTPTDSESSVPVVADSAVPNSAGSGARWTSIEFRAKRKTFRGLVFGEMLLMALTLGIYWFWARTRVRRFIWSNITVNGSQLEYSGRGIELFIGFVVAGIIVGVIYWLLQILIVTLIGPGSSAIVATVGLILFFWFLSAIAIYRTRRYIIRRTSWRGIRCNLDGSTMGFLKRAALPALLTTVTLGLAYPWLSAATNRYLIDNMSLGNVQFRYSGKGKEIFKSWIWVWLLFIPTGGYATMWWRGWLIRYNHSNIQMGDLSMKSSVSPWTVFGIIFLGLILSGLVLYAITIPMFILAGVVGGSITELLTGSLGGQITGVIGVGVIFSIFTALSWGLGLYFVEYKITEYSLQNLVISGSMDWSQIEQVHAQSRGAGDGLEAVLSMDGI